MPAVEVVRLLIATSPLISLPRPSRLPVETVPSASPVNSVPRVMVRLPPLVLIVVSSSARLRLPVVRLPADSVTAGELMVTRPTSLMSRVAVMLTLPPLITGLLPTRPSVTSPPASAVLAETITAPAPAFSPAWTIASPSLLVSVMAPPPPLVTWPLAGASRPTVNRPLSAVMVTAAPLWAPATLTLPLLERMVTAPSRSTLPSVIAASVTRPAVAAT